MIFDLTMGYEVMANNPVSLKKFAFKVHSPTVAGVNFSINLGLTYLLLSRMEIVPVMALPCSNFTHSLLGSLVVPGIILAFMISLSTTWMTIRKCVHGEIMPTLDPGQTWLKRAFGWALFRAVINMTAAYLLGFILLQIRPDMTLSRLKAAVVVGIIVGFLAYMESSAAALRTPKALPTQKTHGGYLCRILHSMNSGRLLKKD